MNYAQLVTAVEDYTENSFPTVDMDTFIRQAEQKIYNIVQLPALRENATASLTPNNKYLSCPNDFLSVFSLAVILPTGEYRYLLDKDVNFIREAFPTPTTTGVPKFYAIFGSQTTFPNELSLILGPTPDAAYGVELHYFYYPDSIVDAGTSWLGDNFDSALLNATLMEALTYMKGEPDMLALYKSRFDESMFLLKQLGDGKNRQDAYRNGQVRIPVK
jgi:hypothetical protein